MEASDSQAFEVPLELQFSMRKAEIHAQDMTWDELYCALLNLYQQRLIEWHALSNLLAEEGLELSFDVPTDLELLQLAASFVDDEDEEGPLLPFA